MKIAFATQDLETVDAHFGWAKNIVLYDLDAGGYKLDHVVSFESNLAEDGNEDKLVPKIDALKGCAILYVAAIGGSGAARVVAQKIHPVKVEKPERISDLLERLRILLAGTPPPWMRKILRDQGEKTADFVEE
ncbi:MAG: nitrogen fixation protein NifX [Nitrospiraceae bacterium]|nr:nitrogen fixation protein NifX [Nitrospiraceae bacterium]